MSAFTKVEDCIWIYSDDWLSLCASDRVKYKLIENYPEAFVYSERDHDDHHDGWNVFIEFENEVDECEFIVRESV